MHIQPEAESGTEQGRHHLFLLRSETETAEHSQRTPVFAIHTIFPIILSAKIRMICFSSSSRSSQQHPFPEISELSTRSNDWRGATSLHVSYTEGKADIAMWDLH